jgi:hypothetical protein
MRTPKAGGGLVCILRCACRGQSNCQGRLHKLQMATCRVSHTLPSGHATDTQVYQAPPNCNVLYHHGPVLQQLLPFPGVMCGGCRRQTSVMYLPHYSVAGMHTNMHSKTSPLLALVDAMSVCYA